MCNIYIIYSQCVFGSVFIAADLGLMMPVSCVKRLLPIVTVQANWIGVHNVSTTFGSWDGEIWISKFSLHPMA